MSIYPTQNVILCMYIILEFLNHGVLVECVRDNILGTNLIYKILTILIIWNLLIKFFWDFLLIYLIKFKSSCFFRIKVSLVKPLISIFTPSNDKFNYVSHVQLRKHSVEEGYLWPVCVFSRWEGEMKNPLGHSTGTRIILFGGISASRRWFQEIR